MKTTMNATILSILIFLVGCATTKTNSNRAERTTAKMEVVEKNINQISVQISATKASLDNLITANESELGEAFDIYQENVDKIIKLKQNLRKNSNEMRTAGNEYFTKWQIEGDSYQSPELREVSTQRREELSKTFNQIAESSSELSRDMEEYIADLSEIEDYLSNDLTTEGINGVKPLSQDVDTQGKRLKVAINQMQNSISTTKPKMMKLARN